jgi:peptidoglycan/xylan/chitin deacetylase (PgdA/CDA1 family)
MFYNASSIAWVRAKMIGVVANSADHSTVVEFFELFKTPWEFWRPGVRYDVLLCSNSAPPENNARLVLLYGSQAQTFEQRHGIKTRSVLAPDFVSFRDGRMPIYGNCLIFEDHVNKVVLNKGTDSAAAISIASDTQAVVRLGFDLFQEVHHLLTKGQPAELAGIPTLELHISLLRDLIVSNGVTLVEIPPVPAGHRFIVALTHDVDHPRVRYHMCDHAMFGFLYRALIGSAIDFCRRRKSLRQIATNWKAACSLPLVFAGIAKDFWNQLDRYLDLERDLTSTFFVIPTKGEAGVDSQGRIRAKRASRYSLADIADDLKKLLSANREVAVHGIDAWRDSVKGREERKYVQKITGTVETGVRMHWLYFDSRTPSTLEQAGFSYDSTVGYNETIGYRAGTAQVFKHIGVDHLLELPLHIMDTALFYPSYLNLSDGQARAATLPLIEHVTRFGGVLTINWHDRSLGPERLWDNAYLALLGDLRARIPWFATASQTVSWFRKRRTASFVRITRDDSSVRIRTATDSGAANVPPLTLRVYNSVSSGHDLPIRDSASFEDFIIDGSDEVLVAA